MPRLTGEPEHTRRTEDDLAIVEGSRDDAVVHKTSQVELVERVQPDQTERRTVDVVQIGQLLLLTFKKLCCNGRKVVLNRYDT